MFHEYDKILNRLYFIMDSILIFFTLSLSYILYCQSDFLRYFTTLYYGAETNIGYTSFYSGHRYDPHQDILLSHKYRAK